MLKPFFILTMFMIAGAEARAAEKYWACLQAVDTVTYPQSVATIFYKATITEKANGQLRGNYTRSPKSMMNYSSIDVSFDAAKNTYFSRADNPAETLQEFELVISGKQVAKDVVVSTSLDGQDIYSAGTLRGYEANLKVTSLVNGALDTIETSELICNENSRKLFTEKK